MAAARLGRRPKGNREALHVRVPKDHKRRYEQEAADAGLCVADYVALVLARAHRLEDPEYVHRGRDLNQAQLPLSA